MGDGLKYVVDLGPPIVRLEPSVIDDSAQLAKVKQIMRKSISLEQANIVYGQLRVPYFTWHLHGRVNDDFAYAWGHASAGTREQTDRILNALTQPLLALAMGLLKQGEEGDAESLRGVLRLLPQGAIQDEIHEILKELL